jgi:hypothetical protein
MIKPSELAYDYGCTVAEAKKIIAKIDPNTVIGWDIFDARRQESFIKRAAKELNIKLDNLSEEKKVKFTEFVSEATDLELGDRLARAKSRYASAKIGTPEEKAAKKELEAAQNAYDEFNSKSWPFKKSGVKESLIEAKDFFTDVDVIKLDPDRADAHDVVSAIMPTLVRMAYTYLAQDKIKYDRNKDDEDPEFEFTKDALEERLDNLIGHVRDRLDMSGHDKLNYITRLKDEFKEKLTEDVQTAPGVKPAANGSLTVNGKTGWMKWVVHGNKKFLMIALKNGDRERIALPPGISVGTEVAQWVKDNWSIIEKIDYDTEGNAS